MGTTRSGRGQENTVNQGPAPERRREEDADITGNVKERGQDPSPDDRERGRGQISASYLVGVEGKAPSEKMGAFRLDLGPRIYRTVGQRPHRLERRA